MFSLSNIFKKNPVVDSVVDNFRTKTTNPFFGTLIAVWIFHNWRLVYMLFNFDKGTKLSKKLEEISGYLDGWDFVWNLLLCVGIALVVVVFTYVFLGISKYISGVYNEKISPRIDAIFGDENIVSKDKYLKLDKELGLLRNENGKYKEDISAIEQEKREIDGGANRLEEEIFKLNESNNKWQEKYSEAIIASDKLLVDVDTLKNKLSDSKALVSKTKIDRAVFKAAKEIVEEENVRLRNKHDSNKVIVDVSNDKNNLRVKELMLKRDSLEVFKAIKHEHVIRRSVAVKRLEDVRVIEEIEGGDYAENTNMFGFTEDGFVIYRALILLGQISEKDIES